MSQRKKLWRQMQGPGKNSVRFDELENFARFCGFTFRIGGADYIFKHPALPWPVFIGKPHGGRDHVWPHDIDRFVDAIEELIGKGLISDLE